MPAVVDALGFDIEIDFDDPAWESYVEQKNRWCKYQPLLHAAGFQLPPEYNPNTVISIDSLKKDGLPFKQTDYPHVLRAHRISDRREVILKFCRVSIQEAEIGAYLAGLPDPDNHVVPVYAVVCLPEPDENLCVLVTPRLRSCYRFPFQTVAQFTDFLRQVLEGIVFMHRHNVAHCDVASGNIVVDEDYAHSDSSPSASSSRGLRFRGILGGRRRSEREKVLPLQYYFIDFGLSCAYTSYETRGVVYGVCGQHRDIPELSEEVPYDPFALDMRQLGEMLAKDFMRTYKGLEFLEPLVAQLRQDVPAERPTAPQALALFEELVRDQQDDVEHDGKADVVPWWVSQHIRRLPAPFASLPAILSRLIYRRLGRRSPPKLKRRDAMPLWVKFVIGLIIVLWIAGSIRLYLLLMRVDSSTINVQLTNPELVAALNGATRGRRIVPKSHADPVYPLPMAIVPDHPELLADDMQP